MSVDEHAEAFAYAVDENGPRWDDGQRYLAEDMVAREFPWLVGRVKPLGLKIIITDGLVDAKIVIAKPEPDELCAFNLRRLGFEVRDAMLQMRFITNAEQRASLILANVAGEGQVVRLWVGGMVIAFVRSVAELRAMCKVFGVKLPAEGEQRITVSVTQADIDGSAFRSMNNSPAGNAIKRHLHDDLRVWVRSARLGVERRGCVLWSTDTPAVVREFHDAYDSDKPVSPFCFVLDVPEQYLMGP